MQFFYLLSVLMLTGSSISLPSETLEERQLCKEPNCTAKCPDGTPYDCCVVYVRDPCSDHQLPKCTGPDDMKCVCKCPKSDKTYLCNAEYFVDPCSPLPSVTTK